MIKPKQSKQDKLLQFSSKIKKIAAKYINKLHEGDIAGDKHADAEGDIEEMITKFFNINMELDETLSEEEQYKQDVGFDKVRDALTNIFWKANMAGQRAYADTFRWTLIGLMMKNRTIQKLRRDATK